MFTCKTHAKCIDEAILNAEEICQNKGLRFTKLRRNVLKIIWLNHKPAKAYDIIKKLDDDDRSGKATKPPTVYRTLDFLIINGFIHRLSSINSYVGCYHPLQHDNCYFLICMKCGEVKECCNDKIREAIKFTSNDNGFFTKNVNIELSGFCNECSVKKFRTRLKIKNEIIN